jgi:hypothetical protein
VGRALLAACERLGRLWRRPSLWLHVDQGNSAALELYRAQGYQVRSSRGVGSKRFLMARGLGEGGAGGGRGGHGAEVEGGASEQVGGGGRKVFVWDAELK